MSVQTAIPIKASTQEHLSIEDIVDDIVLLKDGSCTLVIQVTAINFGLLSESEQDAIIYAYAGLLNSLTFPIQIIVRSIGKDISEYLWLVREQENKQKKPLLLEQLRKYRQFIESTVKDNQVLDKKFYVAIPFSNLELGLAPSIGSSFQRKKKLPYPKPYILEKAKMNLYPKRDHLIRQFGRLGLQTRQLNTQQLMELFYNLYNMEGVGQKFVSSQEYANPIVQPAIVRPPTPAANPFQITQAAIPVSSPLPATQFPSTAARPKLIPSQPLGSTPVAPVMMNRPESPRSPLSGAPVPQPLGNSYRAPSVPVPSSSPPPHQPQVAYQALTPQPGAPARSAPRNQTLVTSAPRPPISPTNQPTYQAIQRPVITSNPTQRVNTAADVAFGYDRSEG